jgi:hypothetical protein
MAKGNELTIEYKNEDLLKVLIASLDAFVSADFIEKMIIAKKRDGTGLEIKNITYEGVSAEERLNQIDDLCSGIMTKPSYSTLQKVELLIDWINEVGGGLTCK